MLPYALSIFTGAFLLFQVQPLIGKYILPWFGGGPGVWTTCLLFFQTLLLGGYAYAHFSSTRLRPQRQAVLHLLLLVISLGLVLFTSPESWKSQVAGDPTWRILLLLTAAIGLPYFVLSATGPLMQQWFSTTNPGVSPYRLYALSNVGSLLALLSYPVFFEVRFARHVQWTMWAVGLGLFVVFCGYCALRVWRHAGAGSAAASGAEAAVETPRALDKLLWVALPAIASILLLATTNKLCQEVAVIPFLWVLPLSLYLLTFIISFDHARWYDRGVFVALLVLSVALVFQLLPVGNDASMKLQVIGYTVALFVACMVCHGELYQLKPAPKFLTAYFLYISAGGALGGFLVAVVAPAVFDDYREMQLGYWLLTYALGVLCFRHRSRTLALAVAAGLLMTLSLLPLLRAQLEGSGGVRDEYVDMFKAHYLWIGGALIIAIWGLVDGSFRRVLPEWRPRTAGFVMVASVGVGVLVVMQWPYKGSTPILVSSRNFYGTLKVFDYNANDPEDNYRLLLHGATTHGFQFQKPEKSIIPTSYYGETSGIGLAMDHLKPGPHSLGLVGLGTGSLAVYGKKGDTLRIYEINPAVQQLARSEFTYLENCRAKVDVVMGDARLMMEDEVARGAGQKFDLLALDAFSSDAIPVHLLTKEAFELYLKQLKPDGVLAVHVSNRYLDLKPVVARLAEHYNLGVAVIEDDEHSDWWFYATTWILVSRDRAFLEQAPIAAATSKPEKTGRDAPFWTDDFASLYAILK
jgi:hypothetical protein